MKRQPAGPASRQRGIVLTLLVLALTLIALAALALGGAFWWYGRDLPALDKATDYRPLQHLQVLSADGVELAQFGSERRIFVPIAQVPQGLRDAVLAVEDAQFYDHAGISLRGLLRATFANLTGGVPQGASTITQQVARTFFLSNRRTAERKIKEALLARRLEATLSKDKILELYLNQIYLGQRSYGFGAAALAYFGKPLAQLNLAETALLAGLPQNPIHANPVASLERATRRQHWVLQRLLKTGRIGQAAHDAALAQPLLIRRASFVDVHAEHVAEMARQAVFQRLGDKAYTDGIRVLTTLRADEQRAAYAALRKAVIAHERKQPWRGPEDFEALPDDPLQATAAAALALRDAADDADLRAAMVLAANPRSITLQLASGEVLTIKPEGPRGVAAALAASAPKELAIRRGAIVRALALNRGKGAEWTLAQWPQAEAAFVALDPADGRVRALVGGFDFGRSQFNRVTQGARQPGSAFKPFLYSAAFEHGVMPATLVDDAPLLAADGTQPNWEPKNSDGRFDGEISVREALVRSKNLVSVRLLQHIGLGPARDWLERFGFDLALQPQNLTLALGSGSVTPLQLAGAYAVLANGGHRITPLLIERITDGQGQVLFQAPAPEALSELNRAIPARNAFLVSSLLNDVTRRGTAARAQAQLQRSDLYGKTGTSNDAVDAWFGGYAPGVVAVAWMGHDDPQSLGEGESGGGLALPIWIDTLSHMLRGVPVQPARDAMAPAGLLRLPPADDWRYREFEFGGWVSRVGQPALPLPASADAAASAPR